MISEIAMGIACILILVFMLLQTIIDRNIYDILRVTNAKKDNEIDRLKAELVTLTKLIEDIYKDTANRSKEPEEGEYER
jgi:low affinity Fe/Cu permease